MSTQDFDNLTKALANRSISRRRALQLAAASALGVAGLGVATRKAEAAPRCPRHRTGCHRLCRNTNKICVCIRTVEGKRVCVHPCCGELCESGADCGENEVCMRSGCCNESGLPTCVTRCTAPDPNYCGVEGEPLRTSSTTWS